MAASSSAFSTNSNPTNASDQPMAWAANPTRKVAGAFSLAIVQMGARLYLPTVGRFLQVDPVEGGAPNNYVYPPNPVNGEDLTGTMCMPKGQNPLDFFSCRHNKEFEQTARTVVNSSIAINVGITAGFAVAAAPVFVPQAIAPLMVRALPTFAAAASSVTHTIQKNNVVRINLNRIAVGPAPQYYNDGRIGSRIPIHIHIEFNLTKLLIQNGSRERFSRKAIILSNMDRLPVRI